MHVIEVTDKSTRKAFRDVPRVLYAKDTLWICPLDNDVESVFDPARNNFHQFGVCTRWILKSEDGKLIGRIAAFVNKKRPIITSKLRADAAFLNASIINGLQTSCLIPHKPG
jgi:hypothetical protein